MGLRARCIRRRGSRYFRALQHAEDGIDEVVVDRAADAAIGQLDHAVVGGDDQFAVDTDRPDLVDDDGDLEPLPVRQDMIQQRGLAAAEKADDDGDRQPVPGVTVTHRRQKYRLCRPPTG